MAKSKTVSLSSPLIGHTGPIQHIVLREPEFGDLIDLGDPIDHIRTKDGHIVRSVNWPILGLYAERCAEGNVGLLLRKLSLKDGMAIQEAILDFFTEAEMANSRTDGSPASSPSTSELTQAP